MWLSVHLFPLYVFLCLLRTVHNEDLFCEKKHKFGNDELDGFISDGYCSYETFGQNFSSEDCKIVEYDNSRAEAKQCSDLHFTTTSSIELTKLFILPLSDSNDFNITFTRNHWKYLRYRLQLKDSEVSNFCIEVYFHDAIYIEDKTTLSFNCRVFDPELQGMNAEFYFSVGESPLQLHGGGHYLMKFPRRDRTKIDQVKIHNWQLLVVLDVSHMPVVRVLWPLAPAHFNVSSYILNVTISDNNSDDWNVFKLYQVNASSCEDGVCLETVSLGYGTYGLKATVQMIDERCKPNLCISESVSAVVVSDWPLHLWLTIILLPLACLMVFISCLCYYCIRRWKDHAVILVLHKATERQHCFAVGVLAKYLETAYNVECSMYEDKDFEDASIDLPSLWRNAFDEADVVMIIASPPPCSYFEYFRNPATVTCGFLELSRRLQVRDPLKRFVVAVPPYCQAEDVPEEGRSLPHFYLPADFGLLSLYMFCPDGCALESSNLVRGIFSRCRCLNLLSGYDKHGTDLKKAWKEAEAVRLIMGTEKGVCCTSDEIPTKDPGSVPDWTRIGIIDLAPSTVTQGCESIRTDGDELESSASILHQFVVDK